MTSLRLWQIAGWTMLHYVWVGAALGAAALLVRQTLRHAPAGVRYLVALATLFLLSVAPVAIGIVVNHNLAPLPYHGPPAEDLASRSGDTDRSGDTGLPVLLKARASPSSTTATATDLSAEASGTGSKQRLITALNLAAMCLPWLWIFGAPASFALTTAGLLGAERLRRQSRPVEDARITDMCRQLAASLKISYRIGVGMCDRIAAPILVGIVRPMILLPAAALAGWDPQQLEMVLLHELAHVRRYDNLVNLLQRIVESVLFFQPMVWIVSGWMRQEREHCCDELVVARTRQPRAYAQMLAALAEQLAPWDNRPVGRDKRSAVPPALSQVVSSMADRPLVARIRRILKKEEQAMQVSRKAVFAVLMCFVILTLLLGEYCALRGGEEDALKTPTLDEARQTAAESAGQTPPDPVETPEKKDYTFAISLSGRATDLQGQPIPGARVYIASKWVDSKRLAETTTDEQGRYALRDVPLPIERSTTNTRRNEGAFEVFGQAAGYGFSWRPQKWFCPQPNNDTLILGQDADVPVTYQVGDKIELDLKFPPPASFRGRIIDDRGQPIAGTELAIRSCEPIPPDGYPTRDSFHVYWSNRGFNSLNERETVPPEIKIRRTDGNGQFEFTGLPPDCRFYIDVHPPGFAMRSVCAATCRPDRKGIQGHPIYADQMELVFATPRDVSVLVLYGDSREPAPKVFVSGGHREASCFDTSNGDGRAVLRLPPGEYALHLLPALGTPYLMTNSTFQVPESPSDEPIVALLRPAGAVEVRVVDADTGQGLPDVDLWRQVAKGHREVHFFRSWEVATHLAHVERPRTNAEGVLRALFEPGKHLIGVGKESFPRGYEVVEADGQEIDAKPGEPVHVTFHLRRPKNAGTTSNPATHGADEPTSVRNSH